MDALKDNYEKFILSIVLCSAIFGLVSRLGNSYKKILIQDFKEKGYIYKIDVESWSGLKYGILGSSLLEAKDTAFSFDKVIYCPYSDCNYIIKSDSPKCSFCDRFILKDSDFILSFKDSDGDGVSNQDEFLMKLNPHDPNDLLEDNDGDGFSNGLEIRTSTDLNDSNDFPPLIWGLSFVKSTRKSLKIFLKAIYTQDESDKSKWEVSMSVRKKNKYFKLNDVVYDGYKIVDLKKESYSNEKGSTIEKVAVVLQKNKGEAFEISPRHKVYPPKSRKYYFKYKLNNKSKSIVLLEGDTLSLKNSSNFSEEYKIVEYKKSGYVVFSREEKYFLVKKTPYIEEMEKKVYRDKKSVDQQSKLNDRTTL